MKLPYFEVDAFTSRLFGGNPAGVCLLDQWLPDTVLQAVAAENNLSETAFVVQRGADFELRWFTPQVEMDLAGHPTLAAAFVLFQERNITMDPLRFRSRGGELTVTRRGDLIQMNFPARPPQPSEIPEALSRGLGRDPVSVGRARDFLAVFANEAEVLALQPDFNALRTLGLPGVIATAPGTECEFVSRFFAPALGIPEDPVTGSAHCTLVPYWSQRLNKTRLFARQVSKRGGELWCEAADDRVLIGGRAVLYLRGEIQVSD